MARTPTPVEPDDTDNDTEFSSYMERLLPGCQSLQELIQAEIKKALLSFNPNPDPSVPGNSGTYLERQNAMLLAQLLKRGVPTESVSIPPPANEPPEEDLPELPPTPKPKAKSSPFWK
jgi:hypothetical protein